jgi:hypothetical protein
MTAVAGQWVGGANAGKHGNTEQKNREAGTSQLHT